MDRDKRDSVRRLVHLLEIRERARREERPPLQIVIAAERLAELENALTLRKIRRKNA